MCGLHPDVMARPRLQTELADWYRMDGSEETSGFAALPVAGNIFEWDLAFPGPAHSPYEAGTICLHVTFPCEYPFQPPEVVFRTRVLHPNLILCSRGVASIDFLEGRWNPGITMWQIAKQLQDVLSEVRDSEPMGNPELFRLHRKDRHEYERRVRDALCPSRDFPALAPDIAATNRMRLRLVQEVMSVDAEDSTYDDELLVSVTNILSAEQRAQLHVPRDCSAAEFRSRLKENLELPACVELRLVLQDGTLLPMRGAAAQERNYFVKCLDTACAGTGLEAADMPPLFSSFGSLTARL
jgi:ubiquitin-conjugating enzyme E2 D/E